MSAETTILQIKDKNLDELRVLLNSKEFINLSTQEKLDFFKKNNVLYSTFFSF